MPETAEYRGEVVQRLQCSSAATSSSSGPKQQSAASRFEATDSNTNQTRVPLRHFCQNVSVDTSSKRSGFPPSHPHFPPAPPYLQLPARSPGPQNFSPASAHSRSLSQPAFFSLDSLPLLSSSTCRESSSPSVSDPLSSDVSMDNPDGPLSAQIQSAAGHFTSSSSGRLGGGGGGGSGGGGGGGGAESLPPRKAHRRSLSEITFTFSGGISPFTQITGVPTVSDPPAPSNLVASKQIHHIKRELEWDRDSDNNTEGMGERRSEGESADELFSAYMNLDALNAGVPGPVDKSCSESREDLDSRASGTKTNGGAESSENEAESRMNGGSATKANSDKAEGIKRPLENTGKLAGGSSRHCRSISMDSYMEKFPTFMEESSKMPPSPGIVSGQHTHSNSMDGVSSTFSLEFGNGEFSGAELKKIMANEKLAEIALTDPKRAKRILANRQSAARSKERKMRYITELEHKVQTLQTEATTLSAQLTLLQRDSAGLTSQNNELKFRLQAMEQQAQLKDALNEALTAEVQRLKLVTRELTDAHSTSNLAQLQINSQMFQLQHSSQLPLYQMQHQQQPQSQQRGNGAGNKLESSK